MAGDISVKRTCESGAISAFVVLMCATMFLVLGIMLDGGLALSAKMKALSTAEEAARSGAGQLDLAAWRRDGTLRIDIPRARAAIAAYVASTGATGYSATVTGTRATVSVQRSQSTQLLTLVGIGTFHLSATASAEARRGISGELP
jgi:Flp pilus assembly protein TadG